MEFLDTLARQFDLPILDWIAEHLWCPALDAVVPLITHLGDAGIFWILAAAALLCFPKYRRAGFSVAVSLVLGLIFCNGILKPLVGRIRPYDFQLREFGKTIPLLIAAPTDFSFPSGHTIASFEAAVAITLHHKKLGIPALVLASAIGFSRLYLYLHYPSDVIVSVCLGTGIAFLGSWLVKKGLQIYENKKHKENDHV